MSRRTKLTTEVHERIGAQVTAGSQLSEAARASQVATDAVDSRLRRGEGRDERYTKEPQRSFALGVRKAQALAEAAAIAALRRAALHDWRAATWLLERAHTERWAAARSREGVESAPDWGTLGDLAVAARPDVVDALRGDE